MQDPEKLKKESRKEFVGKGVVNKLQRRMYSRKKKGFIPWRVRHMLGRQKPTVKDDWTYEKPKAKYVPHTQDSYQWITTVLIISVLFFVLAAVGAFMFLRTTTTPTSVFINSIDISVEGEHSVVSGDVLELQVVITNRSDVDLETSDIVVKYPDGFISPGDYQTPMEVERISLGKIPARTSRRGAIRSIALGRAGSIRDINVELQYRPRDALAVYTQKAGHEVIISTNAMGINIKANKEITSGQTTPITITAKSHSTSILYDAYLVLKVPFGIVLKSASPKAILTKDEIGKRKTYLWNVGTMRPGDERVVTLLVLADGSAGDNKSLLVDVGIGNLQSKRRKLVNLSDAEHMITLRKPFLGVGLSVDKRVADTYTAHSGEEFEVEVAWENNLNVPVSDATIAITLGGTALNKAGVNAGKEGFYRSVDSLLLWDSKTTKKQLENIAPGKKGKFKFKIKPLPLDFLQKVSNPILLFDVHIAGKRLSESGVPEVLKEESHHEIKLAPDVKINSYGLFRSSPFGTKGPLPPKVEYETVYGVALELGNTTSDIHDAVITAELPHYVRWVGNVMPTNENVTYNKVDNTIRWDLGIVEAGTGVRKMPRRIFFAVGLVPSASQIGQMPKIIVNQNFEAFDTYSGEHMRRVIPDITTRLIRDSSFNDKESRVVK